MSHKITMSLRESRRRLGSAAGRLRGPSTPAQAGRQGEMATACRFQGQKNDCARRRRHHLCPQPPRSITRQCLESRPITGANCVTRKDPARPGANFSPNQASWPYPKRLTEPALVRRFPFGYGEPINMRPSFPSLIRLRSPVPVSAEHGEDILPVPRRVRFLSRSQPRPTWGRVGPPQSPACARSAPTIRPVDPRPSALSNSGGVSRSIEAPETAEAPD